MLRVIDILIAHHGAKPQDIKRVLSYPQVFQHCRKSSIIHATGNRPGALVETLQVFAKAGINLTKIESRPVPDKPWECMF